MTNSERIAQLIAEWEEGANYGEEGQRHRASDYALSEDDYRAHLSDEEAAELIARQERAEQEAVRAEQIAGRVLSEHCIRPHWVRNGEQVAALIAEGIRIALDENNAEEAQA